MPDFKGARRSENHGADHARARAKAFAALPEWSTCARCGRSLWKWEKDHRGHSAIHYDHNDTNTGYLGFSHAKCNLRAGAAKGGRMVAANRDRKQPFRPRRTAPPEW
jgi:hypothetical protein